MSFKNICWIGILCAALFGVPGQSVMAATQAEKALTLLQQGKPKKASKMCKKVDTYDDNERRLCLLISAVACNNTQDYKGAERASRSLVAEQVGLKTRLAGLRELGVSLAGQAKNRNARPVIDPSNKTLELLSEAEEIWRTVVAESPEPRPGDLLNLGNVLHARMVFEKDWDREAEIREILFEYLDSAPEGDPGIEWAKVATCTSEQYDALRWDPRQTWTPEQGEKWDKGGTQTLNLGITRPVKTHYPSPQYNPLARAARLEGQMIIRTIIGKDGRIQRVWPMKRMPLCLTEDAMLTLQDWEFKPAELMGEPAEVYYNLTINFSLAPRMAYVF